MGKAYLKLNKLGIKDILYNFGREYLGEEKNRLSHNFQENNFLGCMVGAQGKLFH